MTHYVNNIVVLFIFLLFICKTNSDSSKLPLWSWNCENEKCAPFKPTKTDKLQSLETCQMLCSSMPLWPHPTGPMSLSKTAVPVGADLFQVEVVAAPSDIVRQHIRDAFRMFKQDLRAMDSKGRGFGEGESVIVRISVNGSGDPRMLLDTDESYHLDLKPVSSVSSTLIAEIMAKSFCGARHALETLSQCVWLDPYVGSLLILQEAVVSDAPKYRYRGLMIDTARNYFPVSELMRIIDAMGASKLNTFHWHISDSQAFPLHLNSVALLAQYGAYSPADIYTPDQVKALSRRAKLRGIRVLIEVDIPAHVGNAWNWGSVTEDGDLVHCTVPWSSYCEHPPCGQLNPLNTFVFEVLQSIYSEIIELTEVDDVFHFGGDDISEQCWAEHFNTTDAMELWLEFTRSALQRLEYANGKLPKLIILWYSRFSERIKTEFKDFIHVIGLQIRDVAWSEKYISGLRTVVSHQDAWDLNSGHRAWFEESGSVPYNSWQTFYEHRPWVRKSAGVIEGGEATVWSWTVGAGGLDGLVWPRAAALAERLWTDRAEGASRNVHTRLDMHRGRLISRGVKAAPIWSFWCTQNPYTCN